MLAEFEDPEDGRIKRCLFTGDSHGPVLEKGIRRLAAQRSEDRLAVEVMTAPQEAKSENPDG